MNPTVYVLNGSNLNMLGKREPHLYGHTTLAEVQQRMEGLADELHLACDFRQTNHEGVMVDWIQEAYEKDAAVIINPAGFSFRSIPVLDALKLIQRPLVEVHVTNIHRREEQYRHSLVSLVATGVICGFGVGGYLLALRAVAEAMAAERGA
jgi:3-dehydroquinate dehydratase-2